MTAIMLKLGKENTTIIVAASSSAYTLSKISSIGFKFTFAGVSLFYTPDAS